MSYNCFDLTLLGNSPGCNLRSLRFQNSDRQRNPNNLKHRLRSQWNLLGISCMY